MLYRIYYAKIVQIFCSDKYFTKKRQKIELVKHINYAEESIVQVGLSYEEGKVKLGIRSEE